MERLKELLPWIVCLLLDIAVGMVIWYSGYMYGKHSVAKENLTTGNAVKVKYIKDKSVSPKATKEVGVKNVSIPLVIYPKDKLSYGYAQSIIDTGRYLAATGAKDSLKVTVPITQKTFADSNYTAYVSGYMPNLDSIEVRSKVITHTIINTKTKFRTWNIGVTGGYGYGFTSHRFEPFLGVGVTLNLFR